MRKKLWYTILIECIKDNASYNMEIGNIMELARVKSIGLAYHIANTLETIYKPEYFKITIK